jgi:predicted Zn-dependent protease
MKRNIPLTLSIALLSAFALFSCMTVPDTGRKGLNFISPSKEKELGLTSFQKLKDKGRISNDSAKNAQLQRVGRRLTRVINMPGAEWEFVLFEDSEPNAFALPGGKVGVHTGLFQITQNDAGLAAVIGHEIGHVIARHGAERMSRQTLAAVGGGALAIALGQGDDLNTGQKAAILGAYGAGVTVGAILPFSRKQETESDELGALYMARAGYDPREAIGLWQRFAAYRKASGGGSKIAFLSTHPTDEARIKALREFMPRALQEYQN